MLETEIKELRTQVTALTAALVALTESSQQTAASLAELVKESREEQSDTTTTATTGKAEDTSGAGKTDAKPPRVNKGLVDKVMEKVDCDEKTVRKVLKENGCELDPTINDLVENHGAKFRKTFDAKELAKAVMEEVDIDAKTAAEYVEDASGDVAKAVKRAVADGYTHLVEEPSPQETEEVDEETQDETVDEDGQDDLFGDETEGAPTLEELKKLAAEKMANGVPRGEIKDEINSLGADTMADLTAEGRAKLRDFLNEAEL